MNMPTPRFFMMAVYGDITIGEPLSLRSPSTNKVVIPVSEIKPESGETKQVCYSIKSLGAVAGISRSTVQREINAGRLKARKIGRRTVITHEDATAYLSALRPVDSQLPLDDLDGISVEEMC
jgi:hypothetical protein